jgi:hypothetical protein
MGSKFAQLRAYIGETAVLDVRALALGRIGLALLLLYDLAIRYVDIAAFYSDDGIDPRSEVAPPTFPLFRLYFLSGSVSWATGLFALAALAALALLFGYKSRIANVISWVMLASLQARNTSVLQGGDELLLMFLLWGFFLPLGQRWSIDSLRRPPPPSDPLVSGSASFAFYGQLFMLYFITGTLKLTSQHWRWGNGIYDALSADDFVTSTGRWLYQHYYLSKALSWGTLLLEICGPLLFFIPPRRWKLRVGLVLSFFAFHLGIAACMRLGMFSFVCLVGWIFIVPRELFDRLGSGVVLDGPTAPVDSATPGWSRHIATALFAYLVFAAMVDDRWPEGPWRVALLKPARVFALQEHWGMFVRSREDTGFLVLAAVLNRETQIDLMRKGQTLSWQAPALAIDLFANQRWRKMLMALGSAKNAKRAHRYLQWTCRKENERRETPDKVARLTLTYVRHTVGPLYARGDDDRKEWADLRCSTK